MNPRFTNIWRVIARAWHGRYVRMLEDEVARLRAENHALTNSLLGTAGFPPLVLGDADNAKRKSSEPTIRRRSWPQIAMMREREATRQAGVRAAHARRN
ncbi:MAG: hypothetical protein WA871_13330 [Candidatus Acidiferrales bacterium]